jgi:hypothetical protein
MWQLNSVWREYSHCVASYWSRGGNILTVLSPIGPLWQLNSVVRDVGRAVAERENQSRFLGKGKYQGATRLHLYIFVSVRLPYPLLR